MACGDALGAGYEFGPALPPSTVIVMDGGGPFDWAPGEWTDDSSMAIPLLQELATGNDLRDDAALDRVTSAWISWAQTANDVGNQVRAVTGAATAPTASALRDSADAFTARNERSAGNGSLMRVTPVALGYLSDEGAAVEAARASSSLTHPDPDAVEACVLWTVLIRRAVLTGSLDPAAALAHVSPVWADRLAEAEQRMPIDFPHNGWVVHALQAAWSGIRHGADAVDALEIIVRAGNDTDTVAAIAGGLIGAVHGESALPAAWRAKVHGWPGLRGDDLAALAERAAVGLTRD